MDGISYQRTSNQLTIDESCIKLNAVLNLTVGGVKQRLDGFRLHTCPAAGYPAAIQAHVDALMEYAQDDHIINLEKIGDVPITDPNMQQYKDGKYPGLTFVEAE